MVSTMRRLWIASFAAILLLPALASADANWPQFRGPEARGIPAEEVAGLPDTWSPTENIVWRTEIPGVGWSSPITWGDKIFLTTVVNTGTDEKPKKGLYFGGNRPEAPADEHQWKVLCLSLETGEIVWERDAHVGLPNVGKHLKNSYASETPATDGESIFAYFGNQGLYVYDMEGNPKWSREFEARATRYGWGTAASPIVYEDRVYVVNDNDDESFMLALNKETGEEIWRISREEDSNWATPYIWENEQRTEIITPGTGAVRSYDLDGNPLWETSGMSRIAIPTPFSEFGLLYVASGYVMDKIRPVWAIRPGASGDITLAEGETSNEYIAWYEREAGPYNPSPLIYGDTYYTLLDRGFFTAHNAKTGAEVYSRHRIDPAAAAFTVSPWAYNGKIFCLSEDGDTFVIEAGPEFKVVGKNSLDEMSMSTPAIVGKSLILRTVSALYRIEQEG